MLKLLTGRYGLARELRKLKDLSGKGPGERALDALVERERALRHAWTPGAPEAAPLPPAASPPAQTAAGKPAAP